MTTKPKQFKATILIVEDHSPTLTAVQALLSAVFPACRLLVADSGERALELCASDTPHVVVMDIALPGIDGIEATRRSKLLLPDTRVVMHSSHDLDIYRDAAAAAGASAFVTKSRTFSDLVPAITALLSPAPLGIGGGRQSGNPATRPGKAPPYMIVKISLQTDSMHLFK